MRFLMRAAMTVALGPCGPGCALPTEVELMLDTSPESMELQVGLDGIELPVGVAVSVFVTAHGGKDGRDGLEVDLESDDSDVLRSSTTGGGFFYLVATEVGPRYCGSRPTATMRRRSTSWSSRSSEWHATRRRRDRDALRRFCA